MPKFNNPKSSHRLVPRHFIITLIILFNGSKFWSIVKCFETTRACHCCQEFIAFTMKKRKLFSVKTLRTFSWMRIESFFHARKALHVLSWRHKLREELRELVNWSKMKKKAFINELIEFNGKMWWEWWWKFCARMRAVQYSLGMILDSHYIIHRHREHVEWVFLLSLRLFYLLRVFFHFWGELVIN